MAHLAKTQFCGYLAVAISMTWKQERQARVNNKFRKNKIKAANKDKKKTSQSDFRLIRDQI